MEVIKELPAWNFIPAIKIYNHPIPAKEAFSGMLRKEAVLQISGMVESRLFSPRVIPDATARSFVFEGR
jgi:hypothetical protein